MNGRKKPILHIEDWFTPDGKRTAVIQSDTTNKSFVRMAVLLRKMGVKNCYFHLSLLDPKLLGVKPHQLNDDNDPTQELRLRVGVECKRNPWYFFREVIRIPSQGGSHVPFALHRGNLAMLWCFFNHINYSGTHCRQSGKTISAVAICCYVIYVAGRTMDVAMFTHNADIVQANVKRVKDMREGLPSYLLHKTPHDLDNKEGLYYKEFNNKYMTYVGQKDRRAAGNVGRGATAPFIHGDETAFIANIDISFPVIMSSTNTARANAKKAGQYHSNIFTTTAGDPSTVEGKYIKEYIDKAMKFTEKLYDTKDEAAAHEMVAMNSTNKLVDGTFSYLQLGYTHQWFKNVCEENNLSQSAIARDYLNQWVSLADNPIISKDLTNRMYATMKGDPMYVDVRGDYIINWYRPRELVLQGEYKKKPLIMGMDTSEMIGKDFSTCVAIDPEDLSTVFTFRCNESNLTKLSVFIADLLTDYPKILFVPERKSTAISIIDTVTLVMQKNGQNPFRRIFNRIVDNMGLEEFSRYDINDPSIGYEDATRKYIGFMTSAKTRPVLYKQVLQKAVSMAADKVYDRVLINELTSLQARNGRIDHTLQGNDDMTISWLLACYVIFEGKNLSVYGLDPMTILRAVESRTGKKSPEYIQRQLELRKKIKHMIQQARSTSDTFIKKKYLFDIEQILPLIDQTVTLDPVSVDALKIDSFDYRDIRKEVMSVAKNRNYNPAQIYDAFFGSGDIE